MTIINLDVLPNYSELKPKPDCKLCAGRGTMAYVPGVVGRPDLRADNYRVVMPCTCISKVQELKTRKDER